MEHRNSIRVSRAAAASLRSDLGGLAPDDEVHCLRDDTYCSMSALLRPPRNGSTTLALYPVGYHSPIESQLLALCPTPSST